MTRDRVLTTDDRTKRLRRALADAIVVAREAIKHYADAVDDPDTCEDLELRLRTCQDAFVEREAK